jgi:primosomal replication protein N
MGQFKIKNAENIVIIEGTISKMHRDDNKKLLFYLQHCNIYEDTDDKGVVVQKLHISDYPFSCSGPTADNIERSFANGSLVRVEGFASQSEDSKIVKFKARFCVAAMGLYRNSAELNIKE